MSVVGASIFDVETSNSATVTIVQKAVSTRVRKYAVKPSRVASLLPICLYTLGILLAKSEISLAQVTTDNTVNTTVNQNGNVAEITGGETRGSNLFHSFQDFSVPTGNEAFFNNSSDVANIFSRVTGGNISNIDGVIRANGNASLFLINPAGIIFGEGSRLDIGGSFYGSTANNILFEDGEFSAVDLDNPPLLTVNAPIGLSFRDNPGEITVRGDGLGTRSNNDLIDTEAALRVNSTSTFGLIGGNLNLEGATLKTDGGRIELVSVTGSEQVSFTPVDEGLSLGYEGVENFGDINLSQTAIIDASGLVSGNIRVGANNLTLIEGSQIETSTLSSIPTQETPGNIEITASDTIAIDGASLGDFPGAITSIVLPGAAGDAGDVNIITSNLNLTNGALVDASTLGNGNAGSVSITASDTISIDGGVDNILTGATSVVLLGAQGNAGGVNITTSNLNLTNGGLVDASTFSNGNAGSVEITVSDTISISGSDGILSGVTSSVVSGAEGNAGGVSITTGNLNLTNGALVDTSTLGNGNAGSVSITASDTISIGGGSNNIISGATSIVFPEAVGNAGGVSITTGNLNLANGGAVISSTFGNGNAGSVSIIASDTIRIDNFDADGISDTAITPINPQPVNDTASRIVPTIELNLTEVGSISSSASGNGNAGVLTVQANSLSLENNASIGASTQSGTGGEIELKIAEDLTLRNNSSISARAFQEADGGNLDIDARFIIAFPNGNNDIIASAEQGNGGNINITAETLFGIRQREQNPLTNDIDASSDFGIDGNISINLLDVDVVRGAGELPTNIVLPEQTTTQTCSSNREAVAKNSLTIKGKGGIPAPPVSILDSRNIVINGQTEPKSAIPQPIETSKGKIQPARGVKVTKSGKIILTAYQTDSSRDRLTEIQSNCH